MPFATGQIFYLEIKHQMIKVELIYIPKSGDIFHKNFSLSHPVTVGEIINLSGIYKKYPETCECKMGIFSKPVSIDTLVQDGDRIELYRQLELDPKEKRRKKAKSKKS